MVFAVSIIIQDFELNTGVKVKASSYDKGCIGFLPVYETRELANAAYPEFEKVQLTLIKTESQESK